MKKKILIIAGCLIFGATFAHAQSITINDLTSNAMPAGEMDFTNIFTLDVYSYFSLKGYDTELKRRNFEQTQDYHDKLNELKTLKKLATDTVFYISKPFRGERNQRYVHSTNYTERGWKYFGYYTQYDLSKKGFNFFNGERGKTMPVTFERLGLFYKSRSDIILQQLPATIDKNNGCHLFFPFDEQTGADIENYMENVVIYFFFALSGEADLHPAKKNIYDDQPDPRFLTSKVRIVIVEKNSGTIYYDQSYNSPLKIALQEKLTPAQLAALQAQKEQERREKAQRKAEEAQQNATLSEKYNREKLAAYLTFDNGNITDIAHRVKIAVEQLDFISDTPSGQGKAVEFVAGKMHYFKIESNVQDIQMNGYTVSFWLKDFGTGTIFSRSNEYTYTSPMFSVNSKGYFEMQRHSLPTINFGDATAYMFDHWLLVTFVCDMHDGETTNALYIDGKLSGTYSEKVKNRGIWAKHKWEFGDWQSEKYSHNTCNVMNMKLDNIRIYYRALSEAEVAGIYEEEKTTNVFPKIL